jgi:hypothetical protein
MLQQRCRLESNSSDKKFLAGTIEDRRGNYTARAILSLAFPRVPSPLGREAIRMLDRVLLQSLPHNVARKRAVLLAGTLLPSSISFPNSHRKCIQILKNYHTACRNASCFLPFHLPAPSPAQLLGRLSAMPLIIVCL